MREQRGAAKESETVQTVGVGHAMTFKNIVMFPVAFRAVGLDMAAPLRRQLAESLQRRVGTSGNEAWRHHGLYQRRGIGRVAPDVVNQLFGAAHGLIRRCVAVK